MLSKKKKGKKRGRKPLGDRAMTDAERKRRQRDRERSEVSTDNPKIKSAAEINSRAEELIIQTKKLAEDSQMMVERAKRR